MAHRKPNLPEKPCAACGRPFAWRRKWAAVWEEVRFCSDACRSGRRQAAQKHCARGNMKSPP
ncbi:DUF2256 domain-containing protein [Roseomonas sp. USHLN139]|uniref:DUF2256 domain-containing protein n=1 Tax=Roseomonas sp. USHLN139 TaxID=3081298 RepID=UPI003B01456C